jgi:BMFP domain-containing protein YqiC
LKAPPDDDMSGAAEEGDAMTQTGGRLFDGLGRLMTDAVGVADGLRKEIDVMVRTQAERILADLDLVRREEFDAATDLAANARAESEGLVERVAALEARIAALEAGVSTATANPPIAGIGPEGGY